MCNIHIMGIMGILEEIENTQRRNFKQKGKEAKTKKKQIDGRKISLG